jgi:manganese/zinc/iron transport system permease protein
MDTGAIWIIATASLVAANAAILGSFLIMRKMTMLADAISHAVLPGIVIAYFISGSRASLPVSAGAAVSGILATFLIQTLTKKMKMQEDASIGLSFTFLFAIGVVLISYFGKDIDLDQDCVLYGEIAYVALDVWKINDVSIGPRQFWILVINLIIVVGFVYLFYQRLVLTTFDPAYAASLGISIVFWLYALMGGVSLTTVLSFEAVGAILVVGFFAGLPATAYLLSNNFKQMIFIAVGLGVVASILGYFLAAWVNGSVAGAMSVIVGIEFFVALAVSKLGKFRIQPNHEKVIKPTLGKT